MSKIESIFINNKFNKFYPWFITLIFFLNKRFSLAQQNLKQYQNNLLREDRMRTLIINLYSHIKTLKKVWKFNIRFSEVFSIIEFNWGLPCNKSIGAWRHLLSLFSSDEIIGNLSDNQNTEFSPKKICRCRGSKTAQNWSSKLFLQCVFFPKKN